MKILKGNLGLYFHASHLLALLGITLIIYFNQIFYGVITMIIAGFLRQTLPTLFKELDNMSSMFQRIIPIFFIIWFINSTENKVVKEIWEFIQEKKFHPVFLALFISYFISRYFYDKSHIKELKTEDVINYYENKKETT